MNKKAQLGLYFAFFVVAIIFVVISAVIAPVGVRINTEFYRAGENILLANNDSISEIQDAEIRESIQGINDGAVSAVEQNIEVNGALFQYGWVFLLVITAIGFFLFSRSTVGSDAGRGLV